MTPPAPIADRIAALPDDQAVTVLALVLERQGLTLDPFTQDSQEAHLREALGQPEIADRVAADVNASRGDLARTALTHLIEDDETTSGWVEHAINLPPRPDRDVTLLAIGALVLLAFRADIHLAHQPGKGWTFRFHTKGLTDSTIGKILSQLLGNYLDPNR